MQGDIYNQNEISSSEAIEQWNKAAKEFAKSFANDDEYYHKNIINPCLINLLENVKGKKICDLACGEGHFARDLAKRASNNIDIVCVDASTEMIRIAQEKNAAHKNCLQFIVGDSCNLNKLKNESFDVVVCNMALMDIADYVTTISEVARILKNNGNFVFSILHPCFMTPGSGWIKRNPKSKNPSDKIGWKIDNYHSRLVQKYTIGHDINSETYYFHRTLEDYFSALHQHGFVVTDLREPVPSDEMLINDPGSKPDLKTSAFLVVKAKKAPRISEK